MKRLLVALAFVFGVFALSSANAHPGHGGGPGHGHGGGHGGGHGNGGYTRDYVRCESNGYNYAECGSYKIRRIDRVRVVQQHSKSPCQYGRSWGADRWNIWVSNGCRATFEVTGWSR